VVLDELLSNTIRCGSDGREVTIDLGFRLGKRALEVVITDDAAPFNPLESPSPDTTSSLEGRAVGGLGLMLVKELVDDITYDCEGGRNRVMLDKRLDA
jgi:anti-sigma regulatory factor (Ser/Thr protein kinase)